MTINIQIPDNGKPEHVKITIDGETVGFVTKLKLELTPGKPTVNLENERTFPDDKHVNKQFKDHRWVKFLVAVTPAVPVVAVTPAVPVRSKFGPSVRAKK